MEENKEFENIISDITENETVQKMKNFRQHYNTSCFEHCKNVAFYSYLICKKYNLDYVSVARGAMLHDLFLYDWRVKSAEHKRFHGFTHPKTALQNATKNFNLNKKEKDIIIKHMWPVTLVLPKYKESFIVTFVDKYCAIIETIDGLKHNFKFNKIYRYAYVFLCFLVLKLM